MFLSLYSIKIFKSIESPHQTQRFKVCGCSVCLRNGKEVRGEYFCMTTIQVGVFKNGAFADGHAGVHPLLSMPPSTSGRHHASGADISDKIQHGSGNVQHSRVMNIKTSYY